MTIKKQIWRPDTCGCAVEEQYDADDPNAVMTMTAIVTKCSAHTIVADNQLYGTIYSNIDGENKRKNALHKALLETGSLNLSQLDGNGVLQFKAGISFSWAFSGVAPNRVLTVTVNGAVLTTAQRTTLNTFCTAQFGAGKVVIV